MSGNEQQPHPSSLIDTIPGGLFKRPRIYDRSQHRYETDAQVCSLLRLIARIHGAATNLQLPAQRDLAPNVQDLEPRPTRPRVDESEPRPSVVLPDSASALHTFDQVRRQTTPSWHRPAGHMCALNMGQWLACKFLFCSIGHKLN